MALKRNSKKARENIRAYTLKYIDDGLLDDKNFTGDPTDFKAIAELIYTSFRREKDTDDYCRNMSEQERFIDWTQGVPFNNLFLYWAYRSAIDDLGAILEETEEELARYYNPNTDDPRVVDWNHEQDMKSARLLTILIYREILKAIGK